MFIVLWLLAVKVRPLTEHSVAITDVFEDLWYKSKAFKIKTKFTILLVYSVRTK